MPPNDRSRPFQVVPPSQPHAPADPEEQAINIRIGWKQSARVKTAAVLLGAFSVPTGVLAGVVPWGMRAAGIAMKEDVTALKADIGATIKAQQTAADLAATRDIEVNKKLEVQAASISTLRASIKSLTRRK